MVTASLLEHSLLADSCAEDIARSVQKLKDERDIWRLRAQAYKTAFQTQAMQLREAIDLCVATQAELDNERTSNRRLRDRTNQCWKDEVCSVKTSEGTHSSRTLACDGSLDTVQFDGEWQSTRLTQANFGHIEQLVSRHDFAKARTEIDRILPGPLSNEARIEAMLLKSAICRSSGPDWLLEGLAQCSEALALCNQISDLEYLLPKIQNHRNLCHFLLRDPDQARTAFAAVTSTDPLQDRTSEYRKFSDGAMSMEVAMPRPAFDEHRTITGYEDYLTRRKKAERNVSHQVFMLPI